MVGFMVRDKEVLYGSGDGYRGTMMGFTCAKKTYGILKSLD